MKWLFLIWKVYEAGDVMKPELAEALKNWKGRFYVLYGNLQKPVG